MDLAAYRDQAREFHTELAREKYQHFAGLKDGLAVEPIYRKHHALFSDPAVLELKGAHAAAGPDDEKPLRHLLHFAVDHALNFEVFGEDQEEASRIAGASLDIGDRCVSFHAGAVQLANETDPARRERIFAARTGVIDRLNPVRIRRIQKIHEKAKSLFGRAYVDVHQHLSKVNFPVLRTQLENFLVASESYYSSHLERYATRFLGRGIGSIQPWDVAYLFRGHAYDALFPQDRLLSILKRTLMGLGFDLKKLRNIVIDSAERATKSSQPTCLPVRVPDEVYLVLRPQGGVLDCLTLLHEAAHALHYGCTAATEPFEFRILGDPAVGETYGFLFEYLTLNGDWLQDFLRMAPGDADFQEFNQFRKLYLLRRYAARFLFELALHSRQDLDAADLPQAYAGTLERALHLPVAPATYLHDMGEAFYGTRFLRGWLFEAELRPILINRFGARWYSRPAAGDFLREIWSSGFRYDCDELAGRIRRWGLNLDPLAQEIQK
jgi:hypothetical protein